MVFIVTMFIFMKFRSQTSKNAQDVRKLALESLVCLACLDVFYVFIFVDNFMEGIQNIMVYINIVNIQL